MSENKTLEQVFEEVMKSETLKQKFLAAEKSGSLEAFAAALGCKASLEEIRAFLQSKLGVTGELSMEKLEEVAAGKHEFAGRPASKSGIPLF